MATRTSYGVINKDGTINSGSGDFTVTAQGNGEYIISFSPAFKGTPSIVGSQVLFGDTSQWPTDNIVFPFLNGGAATAITGGSDAGNQSNRSFSFIAIGPA